MSTEQAWKANMEKVAFVKTFPGRISPWEAMRGKTIEKVVFPEGRPGAVLLFTDLSFAVVPRMDEMIPEPSDLLAGILAARPSYEASQPAAYVELDRLIAREKETQRLARLQKVLGAVRNNMAAIPELKDELRRLLDNG